MIVPSFLLRRGALAFVAMLSLAGGSALAQNVPTTFGTIIGNGLLCRDQTANFYYYDYLVKHFGPAYKHEGGAFWFRTDGASLWGREISEVMVSDDTSTYIFVGAVAEATPEELQQAIITQVGVHHIRIDTSAYPVREAKPASRIVYFDTKSKIYCAKYKPLPPVQPPPVRSRPK
ncbi:hypothetical protein [Duganella sp. Leaf61]|uniref:hypothetical protein n=1 Tax=Duganella sp. Leaf61 TaxID=1736227 RepID=UPI0009EA5F05|nr:hypothetical protein [Duganella sp. Leaf61]